MSATIRSVSAKLKCAQLPHRLYLKVNKQSDKRYQKSIFKMVIQKSNVKRIGMRIESRDNIF